MRANLYIDKGMPFISVAPETLTDGSQVWNIYLRGSGQAEVIPCASEKAADEAFTLIASGIKKTMVEPLIL